MRCFHATNGTAESCGSAQTVKRRTTAKLYTVALQPQRTRCTLRLGVQLLSNGLNRPDIPHLEGIA